MTIRTTLRLLTLAAVAVLFGALSATASAAPSALIFYGSAPDQLTVLGRGLTTATSVTVTEIDGDKITVNAGDPRLTLTNTTAKVTDPRLGNSVITSVTVASPASTARGVAYVLSSVNMTRTSSPAPETLRIDGTGLGSVTTLWVTTTQGVTSLGVSPAQRTNNRIEIFAKSLGGLTVLRVDAKVAGDGQNDIVSSVLHRFTIAAGSTPVAVPTVTGLPQLTGTAMVGETLAATTGTWTGATSYAYQWQRCVDATSCSDISGASANTYDVNTDDVNQRIRVLVTATNSGGSTYATSALTDPVQSIPAPDPVSMPTISGTEMDGETLTVDDGTWRSVKPVLETAYQWSRCIAPDGTGCAPISGATSASYTLTSDDVDTYLFVLVAKRSAGGWGRAGVYSGRIAAIPAPDPTGQPQVSGIAMVAETLTATDGEWRSVKPVDSTTYQWSRCPGADGSGCVPIDGAVSTSYTATDADAGQYLEITVSKHSVGGWGHTATVVGPVLAYPAPDPIAQPVISGDLVDGSTLTTSDGQWSSKDAPTFSYAWMSCESAAANATCVPVDGATSSTLTLDSSLVGRYLQSVVTGTGRGGSGHTASSVVGPVEAKPLDPTPPSTFTITTTSGMSLQDITTGVAEPACSALPTGPEGAQRVIWSEAQDDTGIASYEVALDGHVLRGIPAGDPRYYDHVGGGSGAHEWEITAISNGGARTTVTLPFRLDAGEPTVQPLAPLTDDVTDATPTLSWDAQDDNCVARVRFRIDGVFRPEVLSGTQTSYTLTSPLTPGVHTWQVYVVDGYGFGKLGPVQAFTVA